MVVDLTRFGVSKNGFLDPLLQEILTNPPEFVAARLPEAVTIKPNSYTVVSRNKVEGTPAKSQEGSDSDSSSNEEWRSPRTEFSDDSHSESTVVNTIKSGICKTSDARPFYDVNEIPDDHGCRQSPRILKSWNDLAKVSPAGLVNPGVTCYMNAAVQALVHVPALAHYLNEVLTGKYNDNISPKSVTFDLALLFRQMCDKKRKVYPKKLIRRLEDINCMMSEWNMEDSHEYFMSLMSRLQEDSVPKGKKLSSSIIHDIFGGNVSQRVTCRGCGHVSTTLQDLYDLPVSFSKRRRSSAGNEESNHNSKNSNSNKGRYSLEDSIKDFFSPELIKIDRTTKSGYDCDKCKKQTEAVKVSRMNEAPEYLAVHIKRFVFEGSSSRKLKDPMNYPLDLDLTEYSVKDEPLNYKLSSVIVHHGRSVNSGHYVALCRQPNGTWTEYDDEALTRISDNEVLNQESAYMLVYSRLTPRSFIAGNSAPVSSASAVKATSVYETKSREKAKIVVKRGSVSQKTSSLPVKRVRTSPDEIDAIFAASSKKTKVH